MGMITSLILVINMWQFVYILSHFLYMFPFIDKINDETSLIDDLLENVNDEIEVCILCVFYRNEVDSCSCIQL